MNHFDIVFYWRLRRRIWRLAMRLTSDPRKAERVRERLRETDDKEGRQERRKGKDRRRKPRE